jgi:hypothetical protein
VRPTVAELGVDGEVDVGGAAAGGGARAVPAARAIDDLSGTIAIARREGVAGKGGK